MKKKILILTVLVIVYFTISYMINKSNEQLNDGLIIYGYSSCLNLTSGEKTKEPDSLDIKIYTDACILDNSKMMLNVMVDAKNDFFISMIPGSSFNEVKGMSLTDSTYTIIDDSVYLNNYREFYSILSKRNSYFIQRNIFNEYKSKNVIILDFVLSDSAEASGLFNNNRYFLSKIDCRIE